MDYISSACVYCGSSPHVPDTFKKAATDLGMLLARHHIRLVYGGGKTGLMGLVAKAALENKGHVLGYMTTFLHGYEGGYEDITDFHLVESMHERKQHMFEASDSFIILPGGLGTLDEAFEVMTWKQVGLHDKQIIIVDIDGYWSTLFESVFDHMIKNGFVREADRDLFTLVKDVEGVIDALDHKKDRDKNFVAKWG